MNYRYPAEWEPQAATWLAWPHNIANWQSRPGIIDFYSQLIRWITQFQPVILLYPTNRKISEALLASWRHQPYPVIVQSMDTDDIWIRDYGPFFMSGPKEDYCVQFEFNAWGGKFPPWNLDNQIPQRIARLLGINLCSYTPILEGGAIEFNGQGIAMTTQDCLVGKQRNDPKQQPQLETTLCRVFGLEDLIVLPHGLMGDHTDGHIDNLARFVGPQHIVMNQEKNPHHDNYDLLKEVKERLLFWISSRKETGWILDEIPLPPPKQIGSEILPASHMNFIFTNGGLLIPFYGGSSDQDALEYFRRLFPDRVVEGMDCSLVLEEGGSLHCMSKQQPV